jgi:MFS family permease
MPLRLFNHRTNVSSYLVGFCHGFVFIAGCYFLPLYFQAARGDTPLMSGVYVLPYVISLSLMSGVTGLLISKTGQYQYLVWGGAVVQAIGVGLVVMLDRKSSWGEVIIFQLIMGTGSGPLFQAPLIAIHSTINPKDVATATSTFAFLRTLGTALAISLGLTLFQNGMSKQAGSELAGMVGDETMQRITGTSASASVEWIKKLPDAKRFGAQDAYAKGMKGMWWFFLGIALVAVVCSVGIGKHHLSQQLTSTQPVKDRKKVKEEKEGVAV